MDYIKIPIDNWTDSQINSIKKYANSREEININESDVVVAAIDLLHYIFMLHSNMILEERKGKHTTRCYEILTNELIFLQFLINAPKNIEITNHFLYTIATSEKGAEI